ncbi:LysR substrate-binding domain-containing protein [Streptomyces pseudogriseolus]|uniref:LysR substrate-binding domain-containing protein n=1 Tax=Streptomyces pseudogriseolus TaxID=36817 RepID=UPI00346D1828
MEKRHRLTLRDLTAYPLVRMPPGSGLRTVLDQACAAQGVRPSIALKASAADAIADLAVRGLGVAVLSEPMADTYRDRLTPMSSPTRPSRSCSPGSGAPPKTRHCAAC